MIIYNHVTYNFFISYYFVLLFSSNAITISTVSDFVCDNKRPRCLSMSYTTPIHILATVITISCLRHCALVTLWWYYFEYIPTIITSLHYSGSANFDCFITLWSCFYTIKFKNLYQFNPHSYDMGDYIQNIDPCKTWQPLDNGLYIYIYRERYMW